MPIISIIEQPITNDLKAAYRPVVIKITATRTDGNATPPVVYCDIYIGGIYYKSIEKTQYNILNTSNTEWDFDIQDAMQEVLKTFLATNGGTTIVEAVGVMSLVYCKFRSSGYDINGFITSEGTAPVQGTGTIAPVAGTGTQSNSFYVVNSTLQHDQNQNLPTHLNAYKNGTWDANTYPLTHRPNNYKIGIGDSDFFPIIYMGNNIVSCIKLNYKLKNTSGYTSLTNCDFRSLCPVVTGIVASSVDNGNGTQTITVSWNTPDPALTDIQIQYRISGSGNAWTGVDGSVTSPRTLTLPINVYDLQLLMKGACRDNYSSIIPNVGPCVIVGISGSPTMPDAQANIPYNFSIDLTGSAPFTLGTITGKPTWMTIAVSGSTVNFTGTPVNGDIGTVSLSVVINNCSTGSVTFNGSMNVVATASLGVVLSATSTVLSAIFSGGVPPYNYTFACTATGPCNSYSITNPTGTNPDGDLASQTNYSRVLYSATTYVFRCDVVDSLGNTATSNTYTSPSCLVPETMITMKDKNTFPLSYLGKGDLLFGDHNKITSWTEHFVDELYVINNGLLKTSGGHQNIIKPNKIVESVDLKVGDIFIDQEGNDVEITSIEILKGNFKVINISTTTGKYIANGILTHNKFACP